MTRLFEAKPFIIAEVGSNHVGAQPEGLRQCIESIRAAKLAGADAVKFQAFTAEALYGPGTGALTRELPLRWLPILKEAADKCGIELMCTAFSPELVAAVDPFVSVHKIASSDATWPQLLRAVGSTGKPVLLSCGAKTAPEIAQALTYLPVLSPVVLLYCVAAYPARQHNLIEMTALANTFKRRYGFSDHTRDIVWAPFSAAMAGASVIEKHFTAFPDLDSPDRPHSLTPDEFKLMVEYLRGQRRPELAPKPEERDMVLRHTRRLVATRAVSTGETLVYGENFGAYRSLADDVKGLSPFAWELVNGKKARTGLARGEGIGMEDFA